MIVWVGIGWEGNPGNGGGQGVFMLGWDGCEVRMGECPAQGYGLGGGEFTQY